MSANLAKKSRPECLFKLFLWLKPHSVWLGFVSTNFFVQRLIRTYFVAGWTVNSKELHLGHQLGKGDFGDVYEGIFRGQKVAVKSVKDKSKAAQAFLAEASIMT